MEQTDTQNRSLPVWGTIHEVWRLLHTDGKAMVRLVWPWLLGWFAVTIAFPVWEWLTPVPFSDMAIRQLTEQGVLIGAFLVTVPVSTVLMRWAVEGAQNRITVGARELSYVKYTVYMLFMVFAFGALAFIFVKMAIQFYYIPIILEIIILLYLLPRLSLSLVHAALGVVGFEFYEVWRVTGGNGWRLGVVVAVVSVPLVILSDVLPTITLFLQIQSGAVVILSAVINLVSDVLFMIVMPVTLGVIYRWLREFGPKDPDEPEPEACAPG